MVKKKQKWHEEKIKWTAKAVISPSLSTTYEDRWVLVDKETGEIVDDAQGYGFTTERKAYACWAYKNRDKEQEKKIKRWLRNHKSVMKKFKPYFDVQDLKNLLEEEDLWINFPVNELYWVWRRYYVK